MMIWGVILEIEKIWGHIQGKPLYKKPLAGTNTDAKLYNHGSRIWNVQSISCIIGAEFSGYIMC